ncbi:BTB/POZ domain-containing protein 2-like [Paramacrobiotus metropolitanus]|uniref:BTB/POZ domain-containing protein 2-like n=1 Tax=Paramacrobiotus metropolitanus TaxID=2943436 RepID=UPI002445D9DE|nr:BTB/POZ domain-containing protein 2-like [Paramacrobiotus metropolitanus]
MCKEKHMDASSANRREVLGQALFLIRFPLLTDTQLLDGPLQSGLLLQSEGWDIYHFKFADIKPPLSFSTEPRHKLSEHLSLNNNFCGWGFSYMSMEKLLDPANGYVSPTDFSLKLQVQLTLDADLPDKFEFSSGSKVA